MSYLTCAGHQHSMFSQSPLLHVQSLLFILYSQQQWATFFTIAGPKKSCDFFPGHTHNSNKGTHTIRPYYFFPPGVRWATQKLLTSHMRPQAVGCPPLLYRHLMCSSRNNINDDQAIGTPDSWLLQVQSQCLNTVQTHKSWKGFSASYELQRSITV